jgi:hypothetical protein
VAVPITSINVRDAVTSLVQALANPATNFPTLSALVVG